MKKQGRKLTIAWTIVIALVFALLIGGAATPKQSPHGVDPGNGPYKEVDWDREDVQQPVQDDILCGCGEEPVTPEPVVKPTPEPVVKLTKQATPVDLLLKAVEAEDGCSIYRADGSLKENLE